MNEANQAVRPATSNELARAKAKRAIALIDQAANLLSQACGELCPLKWAADQWSEVGDHYDATRELARKVMYSIDYDKIEVDNFE